MSEKKEVYETYLDGKPYVVDENLRPGSPEEGEIFYDVDNDPEPGPHPREDGMTADEGANEAMYPLPTTPLYKGIPQAGVQRLCRNDRCTNIVPPSKNPGVERKFCSYTCSRNHHSRQYTRRRLGRIKAKWLLERHKTTGEQVQFSRTKPSSLAQAEMRYKSHINKGMCPNATDQTSLRCPAHMDADYYSKRRLCLAYAVLVDDLYEEKAKARQMGYMRRWTTDDGRWLEKSDLPHMEHTRGEDEGDGEGIS